MSLRRFAVMSAIAALPATAQNAVDPIDREFSQQVKPFLASYCISCHGGANPAAQFDLRQYASTREVVRDHPRWSLLAEKLRSNEMPPKGLKQPTAAERHRAIEWVESMRQHEARKNAGDPGHVLARRLSNAEYDYSIRDLTGVDLRPTREFPVDPLNPDGFDNSGESLAMSPALLSKYLQAAREIANHLVLQPEGFTFAPHLMLAETDREKYTIQRIVAFYERQPTGYAEYFEAAWRYKHREALKKPDLTLEAIAKEARISAKYLPMVWEFLENKEDEAGPVAKIRTMWRMLPTPEHDQPDLVREGCVKMRDYVLEIRKLSMRHFASPVVKGLSGTSQPLMNWKLRAYASHRRDFDPAALRMEGEPPPALPSQSKMGFFDRSAGEDGVALRNRVLWTKARFGHPDLIVPAGERPRFEAAHARFAKVFPDAFHIKERGRFYPDDSEDKGRLLSAGFHNVMGYFRDDTPLIELILDDAGRAELERLWLEFDCVADHTIRTYTQFYFNQSGEIDGRGRESGSFRPGDTGIAAEKVIFGIREQYLEKAKESEPVALDAIREHFQRVNDTIRMVEKARADAQPTHLDALLRFAARAYRRPLTIAERDDLLAYYQSTREKGSAHEDAMRDCVVLVLMSPTFCYRLDAVEISAAPAPAPTVAPRSRRAPVKAAAVPPAPRTQPLPDHALASRLSYFLWSSIPDAELTAKAASGDLRKPEELQAQVKRMLKDKRSIALATEFAGNWLGYRRFPDHNSVDRQRFPMFTDALRLAMFEEPIRLIDDAIRNDRSALDLIYGTHTFVNSALARHYEMETIRPKPGEWKLVSDARPFGRGGLLPMAVFLTANSPGLRTSPVKRGYWVARKVLGR